MTKMKTTDVIRNQFMKRISTMLTDEGEEVLTVKSNTFSIPWVCGAEEGYINLTFSIPKGARGGEGYDGYEEAQNYAFECEEKAKRKAKKDADKAKKIAKTKSKGD